MTPKELLISQILGAMDQQKGFDSYELLADKMRPLSEKTLSLIIPLLDLHHQGEHQYKFLYGLLGNRNRSERVLNEALFFRPRIKGFIDYHRLIEITQGLRHYNRFRNCDALDELTGVKLEAATALLNVTWYILENISTKSILDTYDDDSRHYVKFITDKKLSGLIMKHYDKAESMVGFIRERRSTDTELLRSFLKDGTALSEGVL